MSCQPYLDFAPFHQQVGMVILALRDRCDRIDEGHCLDKVLELEGLDQLGTLQVPARKGAEPLSYLLLTEK